MEEILLALVQALIELIGFIISASPFDLWLYSSEWRENSGSALKSCYLFLAGLLIGVASLLIYPNSIIHNQGWRIATLFLAPFLAGWWFFAIAKIVSRQNDDVLPKRHFGYAFCVCLGIVMIRFAYAIRI